MFFSAGDEVGFSKMFYIVAEFLGYKIMPTCQK